MGQEPEVYQKVRLEQLRPMGIHSLSTFDRSLTDLGPDQDLDKPLVLARLAGGHLRHMPSCSHCVWPV